MVTLLCGEESQPHLLANPNDAYPSLTPGM